MNTFSSAVPSSSTQMTPSQIQSSSNSAYSVNNQALSTQDSIDMQNANQMQTPTSPSIPAPPSPNAHPARVHTPLNSLDGPSTSSAQSLQLVRYISSQSQTTVSTSPQNTDISMNQLSRAIGDSQNQPNLDALAQSPFRDLANFGFGQTNAIISPQAIVTGLSHSFKIYSIIQCKATETQALRLTG